MKDILVTGAGGGLGREVCKKFLDGGYRVHGTVSPGKLKGTDFKHKNLELYEIDLSSEEKVLAWFTTLHKKNIRYEAVLLLVGGFSMGNIVETPDNRLKDMINRNFFTAYHTSRQALRYFVSQNVPGCFIFISSQPALKPSSGTGYSAYTISKAMLHPFSELLLVEGKNAGVRSHIIVPGVLDTEPNKRSMPDADQSKWTKISEIADVMLELVKNEHTKQSTISM